MAGGKGSRLWPKSHEEIPKQFSHFGDGKTLIAKTYERASKCLQQENIFISINQKHKGLIKKHLPNLSPKNLIVEPETKDTTAAILFAALNQNFQDDDILFFLPSDHHVENVSAFKKCFEEAVDLSLATQQVTLFGIEPTFPADCYGYLKIKSNENKKNLIIEKFIEKPSELEAKELLKKKNYLWNSGMFLFPRSILLKLALAHVPDHFHKITNYYKTIEKNPRKALEDFGSLKKISFDYAVMERIKNMNCIKANFSWSDIGTWEAIYQLFKKDENGNAFLGNVTSFASSNSLVDLENKKINLILNGVKDLFVIQNGNNIYITTREREKLTKQIVKNLTVDGGDILS